MVTKRDAGFEQHDHDEQFTFVDVEDGEKKKNQSYLREGLKLWSEYKPWGEKDALIAVMGYVGAQDASDNWTLKLTPRHLA